MEHLELEHILPNLKVSFHDAGIEAMAFAEAYHKQQLNDMLGDYEPKSERQKSTNYSKQHGSKALHADVRCFLAVYFLIMLI